MYSGKFENDGQDICKDKKGNMIKFNTGKFICKDENGNIISSHDDDGNGFTATYDNHNRITRWNDNKIDHTICYTYLTKYDGSIHVSVLSIKYVNNVKTYTKLVYDMKTLDVLSRHTEVTDKNDNNEIEIDETFKYDFRGNLKFYEKIKNHIHFYADWGSDFNTDTKMITTSIHYNYDGSVTTVDYDEGKTVKKYYSPDKILVSEEVIKRGENSVKEDFYKPSLFIRRKRVSKRTTVFRENSDIKIIVEDFNKFGKLINSEEHYRKNGGII